jgi:hypothetical protein
LQEYESFMTKVASAPFLGLDCRHAPTRVA